MANPQDTTKKKTSLASLRHLIDELDNKIQDQNKSFDTEREITQLKNQISEGLQDHHIATTNLDDDYQRRQIKEIVKNLELTQPTTKTTSESPVSPEELNETVVYEDVPRPAAETPPQEIETPIYSDAPPEDFIDQESFPLESYLAPPDYYSPQPEYPPAEEGVYRPPAPRINYRNISDAYRFLSGGKTLPSFGGLFSQGGAAAASSTAGAAGAGGAAAAPIAVGTATVGLSGGAIAGIALVVILFVLLILFLVLPGNREVTAEYIPDSTGDVSGGGATRGGPLPQLPNNTCIVFNEDITTEQVYNAGGGCGTVNAIPWNQNQTQAQNLSSAVETLSRSSAWVDFLCAAGPVTVTLASQPSTAWGGCQASANEVVFYHEWGLSQSPGSNLYTVAHELGHVLVDRSQEVFDKYRELVGQNGRYEPYLETYDFGKSEREDMPEGLAVFPVYKSYSFTDDSGSPYKLDLPNQYPKHYQFGLFVYGGEF